MSKHAQNQELRRNMMLNEPISRIIPRMAVPTIVAFLINSIYSLADTYFVSFLGTNATAAVSVNASLDQLIMMCGSMLAVGSNSYIARLLGSGDEKKASQVLSTAFFLAAGLGALLMVLGITFMTPMVRLLGATPTCEQYSIDYATYVLLAAPFMATSFVMNQCLRSEGSATLSMIGMGFGGVLNCFLDPLFNPRYPPHFASKAHLSNQTVRRPRRFVTEAGSNADRNGEIDGRLVKLDSASHF